MGIMWHMLMSRQHHCFYKVAMLKLKPDFRNFFSRIHITYWRKCFSEATLYLYPSSSSQDHQSKIIIIATVTCCFSYLFSSYSMSGLGNNPWFLVGRCLDRAPPSYYIQMSKLTLLTVTRSFSYTYVLHFTL